MYQHSYIDSPQKDLPSSYRSERSNFNMDYMKHVNVLKKENQELKNGLRQLNKSLDKILKNSKVNHPSRYLSPSKESEDSLSKKIESTEHLIQKYKKELNSLRESKNSQEYSEKATLNKEISTIKAQINALEEENLKIMKSSQKVVRADDRQAKLEMQILKDRYIALQNMINDDEKVISEFKNSVEEALNMKKRKTGAVKSEDIDLEALKARVTELEVIKKQEEAGWKVKIAEIRRNVEEKEKELADLEAVFKEKDKNCRVKKLQIKAQQREIRGNSFSREKDEASV